MNISEKMLGKINLSRLLESLEDVDAFGNAYEPDRMKMLGSIKKRLETDMEHHLATMEQINDCVEMTEEELFLIGVSVGVRLVKTIQNL